MTKDEIAYDLHYLGEDEETRRQIVLTIARLPAEVARFALAKCSFAAVGEETIAGRVLPKRRLRGDWLILLSESAMRAQDAQSIVAHEIAHARLRHDFLSLDLPETCEVYAANLVAEWGFEGSGANPDYCDALYRTARSLGATTE